MNEWDSDELRNTEDVAAEAMMLPDGLELVVTAGPDIGKVHPIGRGYLRVGSGADCAFVLTDTQVSRRHLQLHATDAGIEISDLDSRNGSYFRGGRIKQLVVGVGASITIGRTELTVRVPPAPNETSLPPERFGELIGRSPQMLQLFQTLARAARSDATVLLHGETGTGKELCAAALHEHSARAKQPFIVCDIGTMTHSLIESELFGHVRGAFTGADADRVGAFSAAHRGTLFLDALDELDRDLQPRLLRVIEQGHVKPLGAATHHEVDVRVIVSSRRDLRVEVKEGRFREDLYHRLSVVPVSVSPLRERREDIPLLVTHFLAGTGLEVPEESLTLLREYAWPGNVRELRNVLTYATSMMSESAPRVLSPSLFLIEQQSAPLPLGSFREEKTRIIASWERQYLERLLEHANGNVSEAARLSGVERASLHRVLRRHGLRGRDTP
jgi:DNA-binding NtrC family response regulator